MPAGAAVQTFERHQSAALLRLFAKCQAKKGERIEGEADFGRAWSLDAPADYGAFGANGGEDLGGPVGA